MEVGHASRAELLSCDVFDTALIRRVGSPSAVFLILGTRLTLKGLVRCTPEVFARARIEANRRARSNAGRGMALTNIYLELQFAFGLSDEEREAIKREELALEADLLVPVPGAADRLRQAREAGMAVAFLSDMYLSSAFLREQLERHGMTAEGDGCYVSCEAGCGKEDGRGFRLMATQEGIELGRIVHRGNDPRADIAAAKALGVATEPFLQGNLHRYEAVLDSHSYATGGLSSAIAGASRLARLSIPATSPREATLRDVAASVVAPVLVSYALWVLFRARALGVRHLVFLTPAASLLMRVADELNGRLGLNMALSKPLGGSDWALVSGVASGALLGPMGRTPGAGGGSEPAAFVFARSTEPGAVAAAETGPVHAYFADDVLRRGHRGQADERRLALFFGWDDGSTAAAGDTPNGDGSLHRMGLPLVQRTIVSVAEHLWLDPESLDLGADLRPALADVMATFLRSPSPAEAEAWGAFAGGEGRNGPAAPIVSPLTLRHLPDALGHGRLGSGPGISWPEASLVLTPPITRRLLTATVRLRNRMGRVGRKVRDLLPRG
jgi:FMN phosphatase YigB (HAD superfamily)